MIKYIIFSKILHFILKIVKYFQMLINGKSSDININHIITSGKNMNISLLKINKIINEVRNGIKQFENMQIRLFYQME